MEGHIVIPRQRVMELRAACSRDDNPAFTRMAAWVDGHRDGGLMEALTAWRFLARLSNSRRKAFVWLAELSEFDDVSA